MKFVALISGGKDSMFSINKMLEEGHELAGLIHITPKNKEIVEIDSYMYQTVGTEIVKFYGECIDSPLFIYETSCRAEDKSLNYTEKEGDEVEDLYKALKEVSGKIEFDAVVSGAIMSTYQKNRVENVCKRLEKFSIAPIWERDQVELFDEIRSKIKAVIVKAASPDLQKECIGMDLNEIKGYVSKKNSKYFNMCGEGGEYETMTLDAPFFKKRIEIKEFLIENHPDEDGKSEKTVFFMKIKKVETKDK